MSAIRSYKNGAGGASGADLAALKPTYQSGNYYYVGNTVSGASDANAGTERAKPLLTTAQANTNAAAGDTIVYLSGHNEVISTAVVLAHAGLSLVGEGTGASVPRLTCGGTVAMLDITGAGILLDNLYFPASSAVPTARVRTAGAGTAMNALQFDCGANDTARSMSFITGAGNVRLTNSRFTSVAAIPGAALEIINATADISMDNVTFDGGSFGWSLSALLGTAAGTRMRLKRIYQLNGSHILLPTGSTGVLNVVGSTGDSRVDWTV
jgi:hypothetical protein